MKRHLSIFSFKITKDAKKVINNLLLLVIFILSIQIVIFYIFQIGVTPELLDLKKNLKSYPDVIYFGDSVSIFVAKSDTDKLTLPQHIQQEIPRFIITTIIHGAYNLNDYANYSKLVSKSSVPPKIAVVSVNMRSFSPAWYKNPPYIFLKEHLFLTFDPFPVDAIYKPLYQLHVLDLLQKYNFINFSNSPIYNGGNFVGRLSSFLKDDYGKSQEEKMKNKIMVNYMYSLSDEHELIKSMQFLAQRLNKKGIKVIFYITPIDYQNAEKYWGNDFKDILEKNIQVIKKVAEANSADYLDLSRSLDTNSFGWKEETYVSEHLNEKGRKLVSHAISTFILAKSE